MPKTVDELIAEAAIKDVHIRYCRANDRRDEELMRGPALGARSGSRDRSDPSYALSLRG